MDADNVADRKAIRRKEKQSRLADQQRREVITSIMSTLSGRAWLWDRLSDCHLFHTTFTSDPYATAFQEGRRSVGLALLADIMQACPDSYIQAMREANERHISNDTGARNPDADPLAERRGSPISDGGDSGTSPDSGAGEGPDPDGDPDALAGWQAPGADIYVDLPKAGG